MINDIPKAFRKTARNIIPLAWTVFLNKQYLQKKYIIGSKMVSIKFDYQIKYKAIPSLMENWGIMPDETTNY